MKNYTADKIIDAQGKPVYPGFIDAHCHFYNYGRFLQEVNLVGTKSYAEVLEKLLAHRQEHPEEPWIVGRGWDQNDWAELEFPNKSPLDSLFPNTPVYLTRIDGHAALVNQKALEQAGIAFPPQAVEGGLIEVKDGQLTGILVDNACDLVSAKIPAPSAKARQKALFEAQEKCFAVGLTSVHDAGLPRQVLETIAQMHQEQTLKMRIYAMISGEGPDLDYYLQKGPQKGDFLSIGSVKLYADGALGSRGACLLAPYADRPKETGFLLASPEKLEARIQEIGAKGFQVNTHCIGDSANRLVLSIYGKILKGKNDRRWRIEHAQVIHPQDFALFKQYQIIPSVQPTHATSDMFWAADRLGAERLRGAYAWKSLLVQNQVLATGSDFPVEDINPLYGFHAAVARQNAEGKPARGFQMENALSREEALRAMTAWAAYAAFEEKTKGSIQKGMVADFVLMENDLMQAPLEALRTIKVRQTYLNGERVYQPLKKGDKE
ncbi:MAG: amidohydrolase [Microscillaceae bacterium]